MSEIIEEYAKRELGYIIRGFEQSPAPVGRGAELFNSDEIRLFVPTAPEYAPRERLSEFRLRAASVRAQGMLGAEYKPIIVVNIVNLPFVNPVAARADVVRTLAIAGQYPREGFERPQREVVSNALYIQEEWLREHDPERQTSFELDPRNYSDRDRHHLIRRILGPEKYLLDCGFRDWKTALDSAPVQARLASIPRSQAQWWMEFLSKPETFLAAREGLLPILDLTRAKGIEDQVGRRLYVATSFLGIVLRVAGLD